MDRQQFIEARRASIGGSDAAAIMGLNPYSSPVRVWAEKLGKAQPKPDNEAMRQGRDLEDYVARRFIEATGKSVDYEPDAFIRNEKYPWAHANPDRMVVGENAGLECKTTSSLRLREFKNGSYPDTYYAQCVHYMAVTGADRWYLAVLVLGKDFFVYTIERDQDEINALMAEEERFWNNYVRPQVQPPVDGSEATSDALDEIYRHVADLTVPLQGREELIGEYVDLKRQLKALTDRKREIEQTIATDLGEASKGACGSYIVSWSPRTRSTFDVQRFTLDNPNIDLSPYYKLTSYRQFGLKEVKYDGR